MPPPEKRNGPPVANRQGRFINAQVSLNTRTEGSAPRRLHEAVEPANLVVALIVARHIAAGRGAA